MWQNLNVTQMKINHFVAGPKKEYSEDCKKKLKEIIQMGRKTNSWFMAHSKVCNMT